jgi:hypothetical protein
LKKTLVGLLMVPALLLGTVVGVGVEATAAEAAVAPSAGDLSYARTTILNQTNAARANVGLPPLVLNASLNQVAQNCSMTQAENFTMNHCNGFQNNYPAGWTVAAENVASGQSIENVTAAWIASSGHYANITNSSATDIGIGYYLDDSGRTYFTQNFAGYAATKTAPSRVGAIAASPQGNGGADVTFVAPSSTGNSPITRYDIQAVAAGQPTVTSTAPSPGTYTIKGLKGGVVYAVSVRAVNAVGAGAWSPVTNVTPVGVPSVNVTSIDVTSTTATVNFTTNNGGSALSKVTATLSSSPDAVLAADATSYTFTNKRPGSNHTGTIYATNALGNSEAIPFSFSTLAVAPDAPTANAIVENKTNLKVSWTEPAFDGGAALTGYEVRLYDAANTVVSTQVVSAATRNYTFTGLTRGQAYRYDVTAVNSVGGTPSTRGGLTVPITAPTATQNVVAELTDEQQIALNWSAPVDDGGKAIVNYEVSIIANGSVQEVKNVTGTNVTFNSDVINAKTNYTFSIRANNGVLAGPSTFSNAIIVPATPTVPGVVTGLTTSNVTTRAFNFKWVEPANNGGTAITGYKYEVKNTSGDIVASQEVAADTFSASVNNLDLYKDYTVTVFALNKKGASNGTSTNVKTLANRPTLITINSAALDADDPSKLNVKVSIGNNGGDSNLDYTVELRDRNTNQVVQTVTNKTGEVSFNGLRSNYAYDVVASATNSGGFSGITATRVTSAVTAAGPTDIAATLNGKQINVTWVAPTETGTYPVSGYKVTVLDAQGAVLATKNTTDAKAAIDLDDAANIVNGGQYTIRVNTLTHKTGLVGASNEIAYKVPATTPFAPQDVKVVTGDKNVTVTWAAPARDGGAAINRYTVNVYDQEGTLVVGSGFSATTNTAVFTRTKPLTSYYVTVYATNSVGNGTAYKSNIFTTGAYSPSALSNATLTSEPGQKSVELNFGKVVNDGGSAVTGYEYRIFNVTDSKFENAWTKTNAATVTYEGAVKGKTYRAEVRAINNVGTGDSFVTASTKVALTTPDVVTNLKAVDVTDTNAVITWNAPTDNGGVAVSSYTVTVIDENGNVLVEEIVDGNTTSFNVDKKLAPNANYSANVIATNSVGNGSGLNYVFKTTTGKATVAQNVTIKLTGTEATSALVTWDAATVHPNVAGLLRYNVKVVNVADGTVVKTVTNVATTSVLTEGLVRGQTYRAEVTASFGTNETASSPVVSTSNVTVAYVAPSVVSNLTFGTDAKLLPTVSWKASADNGGTTVSYDVRIVNSENEQVVLEENTTATTLTGKTELEPNTKYEVSVTAVNSAGSSTAVTKTFTTATVAPSDVYSVKATTEGTVVNSTWEAPIKNGGGTVTYTVKLHDEKGTVVSTIETSARTQAFTGLDRGKTYYVAVQAKNSVGASATVKSNNVFVVPVAPNEPTLTSYTVTGDNRVSVTWAAPEYNGGAAIANYEVTLKDANRNVIKTVTVEGSVRAYDFGTTVDLAPNARHFIEVRALNAYGSSVSSNAAFTTKVVKPTAPQAVNIIVNQETRNIAFSFKQVSQTGGEDVVYSYKLVNVTDGTVLLASEDAEPVTAVSALGERGKTYEVVVTATNSAGSVSTTSKNVTVNAVVSDAPTNVVVDEVAADNAVSLSWTAPAYNGGATVTGYEYSVTDANGTVVTSGKSTTTIAKIAAGVLAPNATYSVAVKAVNSVGVSAVVEAPEAIKTNVVAPGKATIGEVDVTENSAIVNFALPTDLGGDKNITHVVALYKDGVVIGSSSDENPIKFNGLVHASNYEVRVTVSNSVSSTTVAKAFKTSSIAPGEPTDIKVELTGEQSANVSWVAPADNGGEDITGYVVNYSNEDGSVKGSVTVPGTSATLTGLPLGNRYAFTVAAVNNVGNSAISEESGTITTAPSIPIVPINEETFNAMLDSLNELEVIKNGDTLTVKIPDAREDQWFAGFAYSEPVSLGWSFVNNGELTYDVSDVAAGEHHIAVYTTDGQLWGVAAFAVAEEPVVEEPTTETPVDNGGNVTPAPVANNGNTDGDLEGNGNTAPAKDKNTVVKVAATNERKLAFTGSDVVLPIGGAAILLIIAGLGLAFIKRRKEVESD